MKINALRELFHFTQRERCGIIALLSLIFILLLFNIALPYLYENKRTDTSEWDREVNQYLSLKDKQDQQSGRGRFVEFNPNTVTTEELTKMGLPEKVISNWMRYVNKGGRFNKKEDLRKLYGMTTMLYDQLDSFILLPRQVLATSSIYKPVNHNDGSVGSATARKKGGSESIHSVELNSADSVGLVNLPGIGPVLAARIIHYRNLLGGYYSVNQLHEVYGLRDEHFISASPYLDVDSEYLSKFNINFASLRELGRHPYIGFKAARKIVKLRDERGKYSSVDDLTEIMTTDSLKKLVPYLTFGVKE